MKDSISEERREKLKSIIRRLHAGEGVEKVRADFNALIRNVDAEEIAAMEQSLIAEGLPPEEIQRLCEVHVEVFKRSLQRQGRPEKLAGHPVHSFMEENRIAARLVSRLKRTAGRAASRWNPSAGRRDFPELFDRFRQIERHYERKENQLFPFLEAVGFTGPSKVMWGKHDEIRALIREVDTKLAAGDWLVLKKKVKELAGKVRMMIFMEERILFPTSLRKLDTKTWAEIRRGEAAIGYAWIRPGDLWDAELVSSLEGASARPPASPAAAAAEGSFRPAAAPQQAASQNAAPSQAALPAAAASVLIGLEQGALSPEQINLMLKSLPIDISLVDEHDRVRYYSDGRERVFPRSPAVIGREVQNCHPPKSLAAVQAILDDFRGGRRDEAEFWIQMRGGAFVHIRYFALRDAAGAYRGCLEVTQDVTAIRALQGEKRLL